MKPTPRTVEILRPGSRSAPVGDPSRRRTASGPAENAVTRALRMAGLAGTVVAMTAGTIMMGTFVLAAATVLVPIAAAGGLWLAWKHRKTLREIRRHGGKAWVMRKIVVSSGPGRATYARQDEEVVDAEFERCDP